MELLRISYASAPCGSGKTHQLVARACEMARHGMVVIVLQPTIELIDKTIKEELLTRSNAPPHHVFHGDQVPQGGVADAVAKYLKCPQDGGHIIFITHQVLQHVRYWTNKRELHLLIDEDLQVVQHEEHRLPDTHALITEHIKILPYNATFGKVEISDHALNAKARNKDEDAILSVIQNTLRIVTNEHWDSFVNLEQYHRLRDGDGHTLAFHSVLKPEILAGFGSVFMAAAEFEETLAYRLWTEHGVQFVQDTVFTGKLRYNSHANGELVTFYYVTADPWSKRLRDKVLDERTVLDLMLTGAEKLFADAEFVWQANAGYTDDPFGDRGHRLPNKPHGLNAYSHLHDMAFVSSLNPKPDHIKFLNSRELSSEDIRTSIYFATCYQAIMRTSARNPEDTNPKRVLVPDIGVARYLQGLFPDSKIEWLDIGIPKGSMIRKGGRPRKHPSNAARVAQQRQMAKEKVLNRLRELVQDHFKNGGVPDSAHAENPIESISSIGTAVSDGSLFSNKFQGLPFGYLICQDNDAFVFMLKAFHSRKLPNKDSNQLISPSFYDPALCRDHDRGLENIVYCNHLYLDFENGDLRPEEFPKLFPYLRMVVTNSFNHTADEPRFRVVIPTTTIMPPQVYSILQGQIADKLEEAGYSVTNKNNKSAALLRNSLRSGLDTGKQAPNSLFYLPCQAKGSGDGFFKYYADDGREFLDPMQWIENGPIPIAPELVDLDIEDYQHSDSINRSAVVSAIARWRAIPRGQGHAGFWQLAVDLRGAGMGDVNIQMTLKAQAQFARSKGERLAEVTGIIKDLKKKSRVPLKD